MTMRIEWAEITVNHKDSEKLFRKHWPWCSGSRGGIRVVRVGGSIVLGQSLVPPALHTTLESPFNESATRPSVYMHMWSRICVSGNDCLFVCLRYACVHRPGSCWFYTQLRIHRAFLFELLFSLKIPFSSPSYSSKLPPCGLLLKLDSNNKMVIALLEEVLKGCSLQLAYWPDLPKSPFINDKWLSRWRDVDWTQKTIWTATQSRWVCGLFSFKKCHNKEWTIKKLYINKATGKIIRVPLKLKPY